MTRSKTLRRLCKPKCTSEQANGSFHVRFLSIFGGTLSGKKNQIIGFTTLLSCLAFDLKRFVAFCFFLSDFSHHLEVCWGSGHHWRPNTFHSGQSSWAKGRAGCSLAQSEDGPPLPGRSRFEAFFHPSKSVDFGRVPDFEHKKKRFRSTSEVFRGF